MSYVGYRKKVVALKPHRCSWCGETIHPKEQYFKWTSYVDTWVTSSVHPECLPLVQEECSASGGVFFPYEGERPPKPAQSIADQP